LITRNRRKLPDLLSMEDCAIARGGARHQIQSGARAYGAGVRVSQIAHLKVDDIDSTRMLIRVEQG